MSGIELDVRESGALFDGAAAAAFAAYADHVQQHVAEECVSHVRAHLAGVIKVNEGIYESWVHAEHVQDHWEVTDRWIVYGPWLEGDGSRDATTRFHGYHSFRIVSQEFSDHIAEEIALADLPPYLAEANA